MNRVGRCVNRVGRKTVRAGHSALRNMPSIGPLIRLICIYLLRNNLIIVSFLANFNLYTSLACELHKNYSDASLEPVIYLRCVIYYWFNFQVVLE